MMYVDDRLKDHIQVFASSMYHLPNTLLLTTVISKHYGNALITGEAILYKIQP
jgi:hypothetical protein